MAQRLDFSSADFADRFDALLASKREADQDVHVAVAAIIADVRRDGDQALLDLTARFDNLAANFVAHLAVSEAEMQVALDGLDAELRVALELAATRIRAFHEKQLPETIAYRDAAGVELGIRHTPVDAVGLYVPGGTAAYPSSVLMNAVPARVAGVPRVVMVVPAPDGKLNPLVLAAAHLGGVSEIYRVGGAQAVAALDITGVDPARKEFLVGSRVLKEGVTLPLGTSKEQVRVRVTEVAASVEEVGQRIFEYFLHIASGGETKSEALDLGRHEFIPWQIGIVG